ncbi:MAG: hypothetical protein Q9188_007303 [Gyalolechia gomerana]
MLLTSPHHHSPHNRRTQLHLLLHRRQENRYHPSKQPKPRNAPIRKHAQSHMRNLPPIIFLDLPRLPPTSPASPIPQYFPPTFIPPIHNPPISIIVHFIASLYPHPLSMVPIEECGVDFHACDAPARYSELDDDPVVRCGVMPPGFPAVVPCACGDEDAGAADRRFGVCKVGGGGEPFVGGGEDGGVEGGGDEI